MTRAPLYQRRVTEAEFTVQNTVKNIEASGDVLQPKEHGILRIAFQNIHGTTDLQGWEVPSEIEAMEELEIDIMGMAETNRPWSKHQRSLYNAYMQSKFRSSKSNFTAAPATDHRVKYQPGGNLLTVTGEATARIDGQGSDHLGRFCWYKLRGKRDEGVLVIVAYRVCQEKNNNPGPTTAFQQQYVAFTAAGIRNPNPRKLILEDIAKLIREERERGYRAILMMDANGDYQKGKDTGLSSFLTKTHLVDPYADRFGHTRTYLHGKSRLDYIFMDPALVKSITAIGYLATHDGAVSDHIMAYVDMDQHSLFAGLINRPPPPQSRDIRIEQEDKVQAFLRLLRGRFEDNNIEERVHALAKSFAEHKASSENIQSYTKLYGQFLEIVNGASKKLERRISAMPVPLLWQRQAL